MLSHRSSICEPKRRLHQFGSYPITVCVHMMLYTAWHKANIGARTEKDLSKKVFMWPQYFFFFFNLVQQALDEKYTSISFITRKKKKNSK